MASVLHFLQLVSELNQKKKQFIRLQFTGEAYLSFLIKKKNYLAASGLSCSTWALVGACRHLSSCGTPESSGSVAGLVAPRHMQSEFLQACVVNRFSRVRVFVTVWLARLLCLWDSPGKNIGMGVHFLLQGVFLTQG